MQRVWQHLLNQPACSPCLLGITCYVRCCLLHVQIHSEQALYELVTADTFGCDTKQEHVARCMNLPPALGPSRCTAAGTPIPQLLIINIQLPTYAVRVPSTQMGFGG